LSSGAGVTLLLLFWNCCSAFSPQLVGVEPGMKFCSLTFIATANPIIYLGKTGLYR